jgi:tetratricopeptide (TPR) repeat protein
MASSVNNTGMAATGRPGQAGAADYDPPPSRPLQYFLFCAFVITALAYISGQRSDSTSEEISNRMRDAKLDRLVVERGKYLAYTKLGFQAVEQKRYEIAVSNFQNAILQQNTGEAHYNLGNALLLSSKTNEAIKEFQTAMNLDPKIRVPENKKIH